VIPEPLCCAVGAMLEVVHHTLGQGNRKYRAIVCTVS